jgi:hypothetical protein
MRIECVGSVLSTFSYRTTISKETAEADEGRLAKTIQVRADEGEGRGCWGVGVEDNQCSEERAARLSAKIPLEPAKIVTYFDNLRKREKTAARKRMKTLLILVHTPAAVRDQHCGQLWTHIPEFLLVQVMDQLSEGCKNSSVPFGLCAHGWWPVVSAVMRGVCKNVGKKCMMGCYRQCG